ncbi:MAG: cytochrome c [Chthoniobacteraceae bacterium]|nr:cytochrome c [Chthoniobacteraceae bacterium]
MNFRCLIRHLFLFLASAGALDAEEPVHPGARIYEKMCAECHGKNGEGVAEEYKEPLTGDRSLKSLTRRIAKTMPDDDPGACVGEDAAQVAAYIYDAFYSPAAQIRLHPPTIDLARLTVPQYRTVAADLIGQFRGGFQNPADNKHGLKGHYSGPAIEQPAPEPGQKPGEKKKKTQFDRVDKQVVFSFGAQSPDPASMVAEEFSARWEGSVRAEETGVYEFVIRSENGTRLWINDTKTLLIDAWVSAGAEVREEKKSLFLLGGRSYPLVLEFFKFKDKSASIELQWKTPHGVLEPIGEQNLSPQQVHPTMVINTTFPADDRSVGYERGTGLSKAWYQATVSGALAVADYVEANLGELAGIKPEAPDRVERLKDFSRRLIQTAFRRPLSEDQKQFVDTQFANAKSAEIAVKRVVLFTFKSPRFLYPGLHESEQPDDFDAAASLAISLWDSVPDETLFRAAESGKLHTRAEIAAQAARMLADPRTKTKVAGFFHDWLDLDRAEAISKDQQAFPGFDQAVLADLRTSLALFVEEVVWSPRSDYRELLQANYLFLNARLGRFYGKDEVGEGFQRVDFDKNERAGVLTHPYLMSALAHGNLTSPIHRGVFLTRSVLGLGLKPPPMAVEFENSKFDPTFTMREKVTEMTRNTSCMGCHSVINPLGFALEHYDAIGRWRTEDNHKPVDAAGELSFGDGEPLKVSGARDIAEFAVQSESAQKVFVRQLFHHVAKQEPAAFGPDTLDSLRRSFISSEFNIQKLLAEIAVIAASDGLPTAAAPLAQK